jgi:molecular chaperone DnaK
MAKAVGIDLGTTNSVISIMEGGAPIVLESTEGERTTPSVVAFKGEENLVGRIARRQAALNATGTVFEMKRFIGRRWDEVQEESKRTPYKVVQGPDGGVRIDINGKLHTPEELSAMILRKLADDASKKLGERVTKAVITVPAYFNNAQREATANAGKIAGLEVLRIVNEPTAAALAYGLDKKGHETVLVFDLGGGTFDVTVLEIGDGVFEVKSTAGDTHLGGSDFDHMLVTYIAEEYKKESGSDIRKNPQSLQRLIEAAEKAKIELSSTTQTVVSLPFIGMNPVTNTPCQIGVWAKVNRACIGSAIALEQLLITLHGGYCTEDSPSRFLKTFPARFLGNSFSKMIFLGLVALGKSGLSTSAIASGVMSTWVSLSTTNKCTA